MNQPARDDVVMRAYLFTAPRWVLCLLYGLPFGVAMTIFTQFGESSSLSSDVIFGAFVGLVFGIAITVSTESQRRDAQKAVGDISTRDLGTVFRATWRGPVPADPQLRKAALRLAEQRAAQMRRQRVAGLVLSGIMLIPSILLAFSEPKFIILVVLFAYMLTLQLYWPGRLQQRIALLSGRPVTSD